MNMRDLLPLCLLTIASAGANAQESHLYYFNEAPYTSTDGAGPVFQPIGEVITPVTVTIPATTCPDEPVIEVTHFADNSGFAAQAFFTHTYSIEVIFQFDEIDGYNRIIDFSNSASDNGIYVYNGCLNFYPNGSIGTCPGAFDTENYKQLVITRDGDTQTMNVFLNGELFTTYVDAADHYVIDTAPNDSIKFFRDDNVIGNEASPGHLVLIRMADVAFSQTEVEDSFADFCTNILAGMEENRTAPGLRIFPVPADELITISSPEQMDLGTVELLDMRGSLVRQWSIPASVGSRTLDVRTVPPGIYLLRTLVEGQAPATGTVIIGR